MNTYTRNFPKEDTSSIPQVYTEEVTKEDGTTVVHESYKPFKSPYDGMSASSFRISAQIKAGVPLKVVPPSALGDNIYSVDEVTDMLNSKIK